MDTKNNQTNNSMFELKQNKSQVNGTVVCRKTTICDAIEKPINIASDMRLDYIDGVLTLGTIADNYWSGNCAIYERNAVFYLKNSNEIKEFKLFRVGFDDYMQIILNGHTVYVGPDDGDYVEVINKAKTHLNKHINTKVVSNGVKEQPCERGVAWEKDVQIDLKPFLKEGENILKTKVIVSGVGEGWLQISAYKECCSSDGITISGEICDSY